ncbi:FtsK/SpoIIIE family DNA translocase [Butyrivibrio sp. NC2002]|uniref:FtsK/SpoIIIE family DNA translocase n=1 Tax=Butyrivibrio sp. NC2002 TaxID=1410610 RepID=UPI00056B238D|nr:DNA translocase FtsK [Butyrivibrio sp. NC2002]
MATSNSRGGASRRTNTSGRKRSTAAKSRTSNEYKQETLDFSVKSEAMLIIFAALGVFLFLCNFGVCGSMGDALSKVQFGLFGLPAYIMPIVMFGVGALVISNGTSSAAIRKIVSGLMLLLVIAMLLELITGRVQSMSTYDGMMLFNDSMEKKNGGGIVAGSVTYLLYHNLSLAGTLIIMLVVGLISASLFTQKSMVNGIKKGSKRAIEKTRQEANHYRERLDERARIREEERTLLMEQEKLLLEQKEDEKILRMDKKVSGVSMDTVIDADEQYDDNEDDGALDTAESQEREYNIHGLDDEEENEAKQDIFIPEEEIHDDIHEIRFNPNVKTGTAPDGQMFMKTDDLAESRHSINITDENEELENTGDRNDSGYESGYGNRFDNRYENKFNEDNVADESLYATDEYEKDKNDETTAFVRPVARLAKEDEPDNDYNDIPIHSENMAPDYNGEYAIASTDFVKSEKTKQRMQKNAERSVIKTPVKEYVHPPVSLLKKGIKGKGDSAKHLKDTAKALEDTLSMFHVNAKVTDISQGPSVTRYELQPEAGVKVRKIVDLSDDIKMHLAATDIRIEAPIPGKSAVGIEVPNKDNSPVAIRDLIESDEFRKSKSNLSVAVGKDIAGKIVVTDISKMPHLLIAGATGSGKSVCINTIIMSIIYKASPEDVRLIMIDPKIVELSVYNGIPHLLIPVVTDPKKAAAALNWAVAEMTTRYKKFANAKVRDLKGYNAACEQHPEDENMQKMPEIVVIVDELADLMMQFKNEVEDSIVRLTQLARAAGIYLIIATQRPSVDVITGLIKANIPSRIAFAVSSGVDSRTILDSYGAEKLIGKGDMLFFPRGYNKPARVQGCFVSDDEVGAVTDFVKGQNVETEYGGNVQDEISSIEATSKSSSGGSGAEAADMGSEYDPLFQQAGAAIIEKDKASIGMLQRLYKIGFNRAARIMDQLSDAGVVGPEEGTKPRKILMTKEEFDNLINSNAS